MLKLEAKANMPLRFSAHRTSQAEKWYAVYRGVRPGLYNDWATVNMPLTHGFKGAKCHKFNTKHLARTWFLGEFERNDGTDTRGRAWLLLQEGDLP